MDARTVEQHLARGEAEAALSLLLGGDPALLRTPHGRTQLRWAPYQAGRLEDAVEACSGIGPDEPDHLDAACLAGLSHARLGNHDLAVDHFARAREVRPHSPAVARIVAVASAIAGQPDVARQLMREDVADRVGSDAATQMEYLHLSAALRDWTSARFASARVVDYPEHRAAAVEAEITATGMLPGESPTQVIREAAATTLPRSRRWCSS